MLDHIFYIFYLYLSLLIVKLKILCPVLMFWEFFMPY